MPCCQRDALRRLQAASEAAGLRHRPALTGADALFVRTQSLVDSFEGRDAWLASGMETGVNQGYAKLGRMLADGTV
jgi:hypothetical protein